MRVIVWAREALLENWRANRTHRDGLIWFGSALNAPLSPPPPKKKRKKKILSKRVVLLKPLSPKQLQPSKGLCTFYSKSYDGFAQAPLSRTCVRALEDFIKLGSQVLNWEKGPSPVRSCWVELSWPERGVLCVWSVSSDDMVLLIVILQQALFPVKDSLLKTNVSSQKLSWARFGWGEDGKQERNNNTRKMRAIGWSSLASPLSIIEWRTRSPPPPLPAAKPDPNEKGGSRRQGNSDGLCPYSHVYVYASAIVQWAVAPHRELVAVAAAL